MPTRNVNLTPHLASFIDASVASGRYQNASEVVREGLRLLEHHQHEQTLKLERLREAVRIGDEAVERGDYRDLEVDELGAYLAGLGTADEAAR